MTLDNMTGITEGSYTGFCKSQLITCNRVKECNGVCPFEDALKHADREQSLNEQNIDHDREWIIGCIEHDGFIHTHRFDKANQIIHDALSAEAEWIPCSERLPEDGQGVIVTVDDNVYEIKVGSCIYSNGRFHSLYNDLTVTAWMPLPKPYREESEVEE